MAVDSQHAAGQASSGYPGALHPPVAGASSSSSAFHEVSAAHSTEADDGEWLLADPLVVQKLTTDFALEQPATIMQAKDLRMVLTVVAPPEQGTSRAALHLVAVLDKSGSMGDGKLKLVIETMCFMLEHLTERDALGIVVYDTRVEVLAPLTLCDEAGRSKLQKALKQLRPGSQTNLSGGLLRGLDLHHEGIRVAAGEGQQSSLQSLRIGNTYRRLPHDLVAARGLIAKAYRRYSHDEIVFRAPPPKGCERIHEWTMELRFDDPTHMALVHKVVYHLHETFRNPVVEVLQPPFQLRRVGWGYFNVQAKLHLVDGRVLTVEHELCFASPETFKTVLLPLQPPPVQAIPALDASHAATREDASVVRSTFLFTDGLANVGMTSQTDLSMALKNALTELDARRCTVSTFGFGKDHSAELLQELAAAGGGMYSYIESQDQIGEAFGEALGGLLSTTHQNVRVSLELEPGVELVQVRTSYPVDGPVLGTTGKQIVRVDVGDLFAEERRDILLEIKLPEVSAAQDQSIASLHARAFSVLRKCHEQTDPVGIVVSRRPESDLDGAALSHHQVERHQNRYTVTKALKDAGALAAQGDLTGARELLAKVSSSLSASYLTIQGDLVCVGLLADINECLADLRTKDSYRNEGSKKMAYMMGSHGRQRACHGHEASYNTPSASSMKANFSKRGTV